MKSVHYLTTLAPTVLFLSCQLPHLLHHQLPCPWCLTSAISPFHFPLFSLHLSLFLNHSQFKLQNSDSQLHYPLRSPVSHCIFSYGLLGYPPNSISPSSSSTSADVSSSSSFITSFLPQDAMLSAVHAVVVCLSVRLSVCVCHSPVLYENG